MITYIWRRVQVLELLIMQFCPTSYHFLPLEFKYSLEQPDAKYLQSTFFP
jgi:hypothetical protein